MTRLSLFRSPALAVLALVALAGAGTGGLVPARAAEADNPLVDEGSWPELRGDIIGDSAPADAGDSLVMDAPYRAHDAATVPIHLRQPSASAPRIGSAILVIDENPAPVAAELTFGAAMHPLDLELRVRVNQYSNVRLVAQTPDGPVMTGRFVKASGGCSAPATKDPEVALSTMGEIRMKQFTASPTVPGARREAQVMIRHPNYSGLQRNQLTQLFIPAHFIHRLEVRQEGELLFSLDGGISLSENPVIRFAYSDNGGEAFQIHVEDTDGNVWDRTLLKDTAS